MDEIALHELLSDQAGLITRRQAAEAGMSSAAVQWALRRRWRLVLPGVICTTGPQLTRRQELLAGLLLAGPDSMISSVTAAEWHGVAAAESSGLVHVLVPATRHPVSHGFVAVHRTHRPDDAPWLRGPLAITSRARSVVDAARHVGSSDRARAVVAEAVQRRLVTVAALRHELEAGPSAGSRVVRQALAEVEAGSWSVAEGDLFRLVATCRRLPPLWQNPQLTAPDGVRLPTPDGWFDMVGLAIQVHSWRWHSTSDDWEATVMADGVFAEYGIPLVGVTPRSLRQTPEKVLQRLERAVRQAAARPRPDVEAVRRRVLAS